LGREIVHAFEVINNWRSSHSYAINTFQATIRSRLKSIDPTALVAQRLKRFPSIVYKLQRYSGMKLSRMQDIGGLRAVVGNLAQLEALYQSYKSTRLQHIPEGESNYIESPKPSGYRSIHLIYKYNLWGKEDYNGLRVELQLRTKLQHAWATAVETVGTFLNISLKSSEGPGDWLDFFALVSSAFAHIEQTSLVPGYEHLSQHETFRKLVVDEERLQVRDRLSAFTLAVDEISGSRKKGSYFLLTLDPEERTLNLESYGRDSLEQANEDYLKAESEIQGGSKQVVLVKAESVEALRNAYPNYFLDTQEFMSIVNRKVFKQREVYYTTGCKVCA
jgi:putative GTP pyrophosphokinase